MSVCDHSEHTEVGRCAPASAEPVICSGSVHVSGRGQKVLLDFPHLAWGSGKGMDRRHSRGSVRLEGDQESAAASWGRAGSSALGALGLSKELCGLREPPVLLCKPIILLGGPGVPSKTI